MAKMSMTGLRKHGKCAEFLSALGIQCHPGLRWDPHIEGYRDFTFGCKAGPCAPNIMDLCHELAHAAQFGPGQFRQRARPRGFKFNVPTIWIGNTLCDEAATAQATLRELETFAYQAHLLEAAGIQFSRNAMFLYAGELLVRWMHDWYHVPGDDEKARRRWCVEQAERYYARRTQSMVLARLNGWLDKTEARLARAAG